MPFVPHAWRSAGYSSTRRSAATLAACACSRAQPRTYGYALRALGRSPGFTAVAILSLALGIGANTTIFTLVNAVLLRPLPYPDSVRLVVLREQALGSSVTVAVHPLNFLEWRARAHAFDALALVQAIPANVLGADGAEQVAQVQATSELFHVFGVSPTLGRTFTPDETRPGGDGGVVVLGHGFWQRRFGGDAHALGKRLEVSGAGLTIVGVAPPGLRIGLSEPDIYTPLPIDPAKPDATGSRSFQCYGRLKLGISLDTARSEMAVIASALARRYPLDEGYGVFVSTLHDYLVADGRYALQLLMGVVAAVLLIACVNLAGLLMARGLGRRTELAVRVSLGASRGRLVRQLTIESLTLASLGGVAALVVASWATRALVALAAGVLTVGSTEPIRLEATSVAFTMGLAALTALVFGLVPAWQASRVEPHASLASRSRGTTADRRHHRMRRGLVVVQVALSVVLLVGAGLLLRSFTALAHVDPGFDPSGTVTMRIFLGDRPGAERVALLERILERITTLPGVRAASTIQFLPLAGMQCGTGFWLEGQTPGDPSGALPTDCSLVSPRFFDAMRIPILQGRAFDRRDRADSPRVVVVNRSFARRYFPGRQATGRRVLVAGPNQAWAEIIGVSDDIRHNGLTAQPAPTVFLLHAQAPGYITNLIVRTAGDPSVAAPAIERAIHDVDRTQAVSAVKTMEQVRGRLAGPAAPLRVAGGGFRGAGRDARVHRHLRGHRLHRQSANAGDRHPDGARRGAPDRVPRRAVPGPHARAGRAGHRTGRCNRSAGSLVVAPFRREGGRPGDVCGRRWTPAAGLTRGCCDSGVPGRLRRSDVGAQTRVVLPGTRTSPVEPIDRRRS